MTAVYLCMSTLLYLSFADISFFSTTMRIFRQFLSLTLKEKKNTTLVTDTANFLTISGKIPCPHPGRIWLEQRGLQRALYWHIEARVVLDLQEIRNTVRL